MVSYHNDNGILEVRHRHEVIRIQAWGADSVRVRAAQYRIPADSVGALGDAPPPGGDANHDTRSPSNERVRRWSTDGCASTSTSTPSQLSGTADHLPRTVTGRSCSPRAGSTSGCRAPESSPATVPARTRSTSCSRPTPASGSTALGSAARPLNQKGAALDLVQRNGEVSIPFLLSSRGYGLLWNVPAVGPVEFAANGTRWVADDARQIDYWFTAAPTPAAILASYADATGHGPAARVGHRVLAVQAALPQPGGTAGGRARVQAPRPAAGGHRRRLLPLDRPGRLALRRGRVARPAADGRRAGEHGHRADGVGLALGQPCQQNWAEFSDRGLLIGTDYGLEASRPSEDKGDAAPMPVAFYDATNPEARQFVWDAVETQLRPAASASSGWTPASPRSSPRTPPTCCSRAAAPRSPIYPREHARLFAREWPRPGRSRRSASPVRLGRQPAVRRRRVVGRHPRHRTRCAGRSAPA